MKLSNFFKQTAIMIFIMVFGLAFATSIFAAKDVIYPSNVNNVKVNGSLTDFTLNTTVEANGHVTLNTPIIPEAEVSLTAIWFIKNNAGGVLLILAIQGQ
ncbi:MAG: hypothetical protein ACUBOA_01665 [Candidatus Loosdrechtia sp.]|uniref:hypothetical protein n=1 Tax=Candidatus Loosdrechtia sp. TaxID=3101272 RepID=UPI003A6A1CE9|nr:MAG: hypothetical protein QY305_07120 [Candidatus Jettenia sp. AMX2]